MPGGKCNFSLKTAPLEVGQYKVAIVMLVRKHDSSTAYAQMGKEILFRVVTPEMSELGPTIPYKLRRRPRTAWSNLTIVPGVKPSAGSKSFTKCRLKPYTITAEVKKIISGMHNF